MTSKSTEAILFDAFHGVFDVKDRQEPGSQTFYRAYEAISAIGDLMHLLGHPVPQRFDAPRDPAAYNHIFRTPLGLPPEKSDKPLCEAELPDSWDFAEGSADRPGCPVCLDKMEGAGRFRSV